MAVLFQISTFPFVLPEQKPGQANADRFMRWQEKMRCRTW